MQAITMSTKSAKQRQQEWEQLQKCDLSKVNDRDRTILALWYLQQQSLAEIAEQLDLSREGVRHILSQIKQRFQINAAPSRNEEFIAQYGAYLKYLPKEENQVLDYILNKNWKYDAVGEVLGLNFQQVAFMNTRARSRVKLIAGCINQRQSATDITAVTGKLTMARVDYLGKLIAKQVVVTEVQREEALIEVRYFIDVCYKGRPSKREQVNLYEPPVVFFHDWVEIKDFADLAKHPMLFVAF